MDTNQTTAAINQGLVPQVVNGRTVMVPRGTVIYAFRGVEVWGRTKGEAVDKIVHAFAVRDGKNTDPLTVFKEMKVIKTIH